MPSSCTDWVKGHTGRETEGGPSLRYEQGESGREKPSETTAAGRRRGGEGRWRLRWRRGGTWQERGEGEEELGEGAASSGRSAEAVRQSGWVERRERAIGPERQLNTSGQRCDSSHGAAQNKQAAGCCQETELPCADFTHAVTAEAVIKPAMWPPLQTGGRGLVRRRSVSCPSHSPRTAGRPRVCARTNEHKRGTCAHWTKRERERAQKRGGSFKKRCSNQS